MVADQARGRARRTAIVAAAAIVLERDGVDGLTHRTAAAEAGVPLGSTTYYFTGRDDLVAAAMDAWLTAEETRIADLVDALPRRRRGARATAEVVVDLLVGRDRVGDGTALTRYYARCVELGRLGTHRPRLARSRRAYDERLAEALERCGVEPGAVDLGLVTAATDGSLLNSLIDGVPDPWATAVRTVAACLEGDRGRTADP